MPGLAYPGLAWPGLAGASWRARRRAIVLTQDITPPLPRWNAAPDQ